MRAFTQDDAHIFCTEDQILDECVAYTTLLQKVYFPSYVPVLGAALAILVQTLIECCILAVVLLVFGNIGPTWLLFPVWLALFVVFVTALALSLAIVNIHVRDLAQMVNVALTLLFFLTPIKDAFMARFIPPSSQ